MLRLHKKKKTRSEHEAGLPVTFLILLPFSLSYLPQLFSSKKLKIIKYPFYKTVSIPERYLYLKKKSSGIVGIELRPLCWQARAQTHHRSFSLFILRVTLKKNRTMRAAKNREFFVTIPYLIQVKVVQWQIVPMEMQNDNNFNN